MKYKLYLFDFDYTLADSSEGIVHCFRQVLLENNFVNISDHAIKRTIGKSLEESFELLTGVTDSTQLALLKKRYVKEADLHMTAKTYLYPETKEVILALKAHGVQLGIISTKYRYRIEEFLPKHFDFNPFEIIIGGEDVQLPKPSPEGIERAISHLQIERANVLYVGDSTVDAKAANAANVDFAGILHGLTSADELEQYPFVAIMNDLKELLHHTP